MNTSLTTIILCCSALCLLFILWIIYQCIYFVNNIEIQRHQAFTIRGKNMFYLTAVIVILNFIFRPLLVSLSLMDQITIDSIIWRGVIDICQMALYAIVEFRCWMTYFTLMSSTAMIDNKWKQYLQRTDDTDKVNGCFFNYRYVFGNPLYVGAFFATHGALCVIICSLVESYLSSNPHRIIAHFFTANTLIFVLFIHRMYTSFVLHNYSHDMLSVHKELNFITIIMTVTAICDTTLGAAVGIRNVAYVVYQTALIMALSIIIFYMPQRTIHYLQQLERSSENNDDNAVTLKDVFTDKDFFHSFIRFALAEWSVENVLFVTQWMQIQKIIVDSGIGVKLNAQYSCELFALPSDTIIHSDNILEAARAIYDKFVNTTDILQINISHASKQKLRMFFSVHKDFEPRSSDASSIATVMVHKCEQFVEQLKSGDMDVNVIQEMVDVYRGAMRDCWSNLIGLFLRFQHTVSYKKGILNLKRRRSESLFSSIKIWTKSNI
eukprot:134769_1